MKQLEHRVHHGPLVLLTHLKYWVHTFAKCRKDGWIDWYLSCEFCVELWNIIVTSLKKEKKKFDRSLGYTDTHCGIWSTTKSMWWTRTNNGLIGGSNRLANTSSQLTNLKNWWLFIGTASFEPEPKRWETCRFINFRIKSLASGVK